MHSDDFANRDGAVTNPSRMPCLFGLLGRGETSLGVDFFLRDRGVPMQENPYRAENREEQGTAQHGNGKREEREASHGAIVAVANRTQAVILDARVVVLIAKTIVGEAFSLRRGPNAPSEHAVAAVSFVGGASLAVREVGARGIAELVAVVESGCGAVDGDNAHE